MTKNVFFAAPPICRTKEVADVHHDLDDLEDGRDGEAGEKSPHGNLAVRPGPALTSRVASTLQRSTFITASPFSSYVYCPFWAVLSRLSCPVVQYWLPCPLYLVLGFMSRLSCLCSCPELAVLFWLSSPSFPVSGSAALAIIFLLSCPLFPWRSALLLASD
jgi:hypothetical protein